MLLKERRTNRGKENQRKMWITGQRDILMIRRTRTRTIRTSVARGQIDSKERAPAKTNLPMYFYYYRLTSGSCDGKREVRSDARGRERKGAKGTPGDVSGIGVAC